MDTGILSLGSKTAVGRVVAFLAMLGVASNVGVCLCPDEGDQGRSCADSRPPASAPHSHSHSHANPHSHSHDDAGKEAPAGHAHGPSGECTCGGAELSIKTEDAVTICSSVTRETPGVSVLTSPEREPSLHDALGMTPPAVGPPRSDPVPLLIRLRRLLL